jgi:malate synthase
VSALEALEVLAPGDPEVLTTEALALVAQLHRELEPRRQALLRAREQRRAALAAGGSLGFLPDTARIRGGDWTVAPAPADLRDRRCEITGPVERKMMINALNSGASGFMADFEDSCSPTWANMLAGQRNLVDAVAGTISLETPEKRYTLGGEVATLLIRPRGWHLDERHLEIDGGAVSGSLFDFGLACAHIARAQLERGSGPYFYLPKLESHHEAALWADAFRLVEDALGLPRGSIRCTVLIETIPAAFETEEILYELREWGCALNAGRWDYLFSVIKTLDPLLPDRDQLTMTVPFMRSYSQRVVASCHAHGAHAIGGMAAFIPSRRDPELNERALARVRDDKEREAADGFDGTWVAHPDLVPVASEVFGRLLGSADNQLGTRRQPPGSDAAALLNFGVDGGAVTVAGLRKNVSVATRYLDSWLHGVGAAAIDNLMEDVATAEISRAQVWSWLRRGLFGREQVAAELAAVDASEEARDLFAAVALAEELPEFLTLEGCRRLG